MKQLGFFSYVTLAFLMGCSSSSKDSKEIVGVDLQSIDQTIDPCSDFYAFSNGSWIKNNPIPSTESRWSNFNVLRDKNDSILISILKDAANNKGDANVGAFYRSAMDTNKINALGIQAIQNELERIDALESTDQLPSLLAHHDMIGLGSFITTSIYQDIKQNTKYTVYLSPGQLGLPDRDYYVLDHLKDKKMAYEHHVEAMFELAGYSHADAVIKRAEIMKAETILAENSFTRVESRDPEKTYNKKSVDQLNSLASNFDWNAYYTALGIDQLDTVIVEEPRFVDAFNALLSDDLSLIKTMLEWNLINVCASKIGDEFEQKDFEFYATYLKGVKAMKPRWKRVLRSANSSLGELLGKEYVKVAFSKENKEKVDKMVDGLIGVLELRLKDLDWMGEQTKAQALKKLSTITRKMGYPSEWKDYSSLSLTDESYILNWFKCNEFAYKEDLKKLGGPIDKNEWYMPPQTVNAYYNPVMNEIVFPAGILQPPFFGIDNDDAINYGSMGAVIGHELTHGFDDTGNQFDADGNLKNWWTDQDKKNFKEKAQKLIDQFSAYEVLDSTFINGELTQGENIADLGGLSIAFEAYMNTLSEEEKATKIDGYLPAQRFFIAFAQVWRNNQTDEYLKQQVLTDPHSPAKYRVIGVLKNMPQFRQAFGTCSTTEHSEHEMIKIW